MYQPLTLCNMADLDNGLPPQGIDISDSSIQSVSISKKQFHNEATTAEISHISVKKEIHKAETKTTDVGFVSIKKLAGYNTALFL